MALAFAGVFVPGLPVTVFVLIALWFFARSSPRFESWLRTNSLFGTRLQHFRDRGGMPRSAKLAAIASMWTAITISSAVLASVSIVGTLVTIMLGGIGTLTIVGALSQQANLNEFLIPQRGIFAVARAFLEAPKVTSEQKRAPAAEPAIM